MYAIRSYYAAWPQSLFGAPGSVPAGHQVAVRRLAVAISVKERFNLVRRFRGSRTARVKNDLPAAVILEPPDRIEGAPVLHGLAILAVDNYAVGSRITSYNVCYTKLLRC